ALLLGVSVAWRQRGTRGGLLFLLVPLTIAAWAACFSLMLCARDAAVALVWARAAYLAIPLIPAAVYSFTLASTRSERPRRQRAVLLWLLAAACLGLFVGSDVFLDGLHRYAWGCYPRFRWPTLFFVAYFLGGLALSLREQQLDAERAGTEVHRGRSRA